ncbi:MAG: hypothetical protein ACOYVF_05475, partial [Candidatus Zixiibacteriota bacterium]
MSKGFTIHKLLLSLLLFIGLVPVFYFVSVEVGIAEAAANLSETNPNDETAVLDTTDRFVDNFSFGVGEKLT